MNPMRPPRSVCYDTDTGNSTKQESRLEHHLGSLGSAITELSMRIELLEARLTPIVTVPPPVPEPQDTNKTMCAPAPARSVVCDKIANNTERLDSIIRRVNTLLDTIDL